MRINNKIITIGILMWLMSSVALACDLSKIDVEKAYVLAGPVGQVNTAGYARIHNAGDTVCVLAGAHSAIATTIELHTIVEQAGVFKMQPVPAFTIPAHGALLLTRGGNHLMFLQLKSSLKVGDTVPVTLQFAEGKQKTEQFVVKDMKATLHK